MSRLGHGGPISRLRWLVRGLRNPGSPAESRRRSVSVVGHRGAPRIAPENTIASFRAAIAAGADAIETDVCVTRDGRFVLWHDASPSQTIAFARQTGREGLLYEPDVPLLFSRLRRPVSRLDWETFRAHYGYCRRRRGLGNIVGNGDGPPEVPASTLQDLFAWAAGETRVTEVFLDLKLTSGQVPAAVELFREVESFVGRSEVRGRVVFHLLSQFVEVLEALCAHARRSAGPVSIFGDFEKPDALEFASAIGLEHVSLGMGQRLWPGFRAELAEVLAARDSGRIRSVVVWTFNDEPRLRELIDRGVDGILSDDPGLLRRILDPERPEGVAGGS